MSGDFTEQGPIQFSDFIGEKGEVIKKSVSFEKAILETTFIDGRVFAGADQITLDDLNEGIEELGELTDMDADGGEVARVYFVSLEGTLSEGELVEGDTEIEYDPDFYVKTEDPSVPRRERQGRFTGSAFHSHDRPSPPSFSDLIVLLEDDSVPDAATSVGLITPTAKTVIFRGSNTPRFTLDEAIEFADKYDKELEKIYTESLHILKPNFSFEDGDLTDVEWEIYELMSTLKARQFFREIAGELDLQVFEGEADANELDRVKLSSPEEN